MTDQTARRVLADHVRMYDSFRERDVCICDKWNDFDTDEDFTDHVLAAFAAARVAVVPLPEPLPDGWWPESNWERWLVHATNGLVIAEGEAEGGFHEFQPVEARNLALALLAAADAAEVPAVSSLQEKP